jgi:hypothetical protein
MKSTPKKGKGPPGNRRYGDGRAAFLGLVEKLQKWVSEGRTIRAFYDQHQADLPISYPQFTRHARTYIEKPVAKRKPHAIQSNSQPTQTPPTRPKPAAQKPGAAPQFQFRAGDVDDDKLI